MVRAVAVIHAVPGHVQNKERKEKKENKEKKESRG